MPGYVYRGSGKDELTGWMDRPRRKMPKMHKNMCRKCLHLYNSRHHLDLCRPAYLATPKADRSNKNYCQKCGNGYNSNAHRESCLSKSGSS